LEAVGQALYTGDSVEAEDLVGVVSHLQRLVGAEAVLARRCSHVQLHLATGASSGTVASLAHIGRERARPGLTSNSTLGLYLPSSEGRGSVDHMYQQV